MRTLVILNPTAGGRADADDVRRRIEGRLEGDLVCSSGPGDAVGLAEDAARKGYDVVVAAGGDGTVREVATGLHLGGGSPRLGILPIGTGNDLACSLGLPEGVDEAMSVATGARSAALDLIRASGIDGRGEVRFSANAAVAGFGGRIGDAMRPGLRRRLRSVAYPLAAVSQIRDLRPYEVRLEVDGRPIAARSLMVIVANGEHAGGRLRLAPGATTDDGLLDLVLVHAVRPWQLSTLVPRVLMGRHAGHSGVSMFRARTIRLESDPPMWMNLDGDTWRTGPVDFDVLPGALQVAVS
jgi:diacylglycerol kinase (ATP)